MHQAISPEFNILHLFSGYNTFTDVCAAHNVNVVSLDRKNYRKCTKSTIICDFLEFNYKAHSPFAYDFILIGFPCTTFSKASGGKHFKGGSPITAQAHESIIMLKYLQKITAHFKCHFMIENPTSALFNNNYFTAIYSHTQLYYIRLHQKSFGHMANKQTDLATTKNGLIMNNPVYRVNGKYSPKKFSNMTLKQRQSYPVPFCEALLKFILE